MDITYISKTQSGNEITIKTDLGYFDISKADAGQFFAEFFDSDIEEAACHLPLFLENNAAGRLVVLSEKLACIKYAVYLLGISDKSERQLRTKLMEKGYKPEVCDMALDVLKRNGYVSDERFCRRKCEILANSKLFGRRRIISELVQKGISSDLCSQIIDELEIDFEENLGQLFEKLTRSKDINFLDRKEVKKFSDKLLRYGYSYYEIKDVLDAYLEDCDGF